MIRIGEIPYANCIPLFYALRKLTSEMDVTYLQGEPAELNRKLFEGQIDLAPSSSLEYGLHPDRYLLIPNISISAREKIESVLLLSRYPIENLAGKTILLSSASASSNALIRILLAKHYKITCRYLLSTAGSGEGSARPDAEIMIGDIALKTFLSKEKKGFLYDLGVLWHQFTGLPFVFALWIVRKAAVERNFREIEFLMKRLSESKEYVRTHLEEIAKVSPSAGLHPEDLLRYWDGISYELDGEEIRGLTLYYRYAEELGLLPKKPLLKFL